jgi:hypothetical protein
VVALRFGGEGSAPGSSMEWQWRDGEWSCRRARKGWCVEEQGSGGGQDGTTARSGGGVLGLGRNTGHQMIERDEVVALHI